jgi:hypothetical protein
MRPLPVVVIAVFAVMALVMGCATLPPEAAGTLKVQCNVADAAVLLDDVVVGRASELGKTAKSLPPGFYRVELRHPGYYSHFAEVDVPEGGATAIKAELHPLLD